MGDRSGRARRPGRAVLAGRVGRGALVSVLERLAELEAAATRPWDVDWNGPLTAIHASDGSGKHVAKASTVADAEFIVAARNALPALIAVARAAEGLRAGAVGNGKYAGHSVTVGRDEYATLVAAIAALEASSE